MQQEEERERDQEDPNPGPSRSAAGDRKKRKQATHQPGTENKTRKLSQAEKDRIWDNTRRPPRPRSNEGTRTRPVPTFRRSPSGNPEIPVDDGGDEDEDADTPQRPTRVTRSSTMISSGENEIFFKDSQQYLPPNQQQLRDGTEPAEDLTEDDMANQDGMDTASDNGNDPGLSRGAEKSLTVGDMAKLLDSRLEDMAKASQVARMSETLRELSGKVDGNSDDIRKLKSRLEKLERSPANHDVRNHAPPHYPLAARVRTSEQEEARVKEYERARRSLRIWPIAGSQDREIEDSFKSFLAEALLIPSSDFTATGIEQVRRVASPRGALAYDEVLVLFSTPEKRDDFFAKGKLLAPYKDDENKPTAGFRMEVPAYLMSTFRCLRDVGFELRRKHGISFRRYIKYDDENCDLYLEVKLPGRPNWRRISPSVARDMRDLADRDELMNSSSSPGAENVRGPMPRIRGDRRTDRGVENDIEMLAEIRRVAAPAAKKSPTRQKPSSLVDPPMVLTPPRLRTRNGGGKGNDDPGNWKPGRRSR